MRKTLRRLIAGLLIGGMLTCPVFASSAFPDVPENAEYAEAAEYLKDTGIMRGDDKGNFNPNNTVTRAEMAVIICNMLGEADDVVKTGGIFTDVPESYWASGYIAKAVSLEIISGYGDGRFGPNDKVTYEQAVTIIVRIAGWDETVEDISTIGGYPDGYISLALERGLLDGISGQKGEILSRAVIASIIFNFYVPPFMT